MLHGYRILVGKHGGKITLVRPRHRSDDIVTADVRETVWEFADWMRLVQFRDQWRGLVKN